MKSLRTSEVAQDKPNANDVPTAWAGFFSFAVICQLVSLIGSEATFSWFAILCGIISVVSMLGVFPWPQSRVEQPKATNSPFQQEVRRRNLVKAMALVSLGAGLLMLMVASKSFSSLPIGTISGCLALITFFVAGLMLFRHSHCE